MNYWVYHWRKSYESFGLGCAYPHNSRDARLCSYISTADDRESRAKGFRQFGFYTGPTPVIVRPVDFFEPQSVLEFCGDHVEHHTEEALAQAITELEAVKQNAHAATAQKVTAQNRLAHLYFDRAKMLYSDEIKTDFSSAFIEASREAANACFEVSNLATPIENVDQSVIQEIREALIRAGQIYYSLGKMTEQPGDLDNALISLKRFIKYADNGVSPESEVLQERLQTALTYLAAAYFERGRGQARLDEELNEKVAAYFEQEAETFKALIHHFPNAKDVPLWQFHLGESYYAVEQYSQAIAEYEKVRRTHPNHELAAKSLFVSAICYSLMAENAWKTENIRAKWLAKTFETYETLVESYPSSPYAADALLLLDNRYYREMTVTEKTDERLKRLNLAIEKYHQATMVPPVSASIKATAQHYLRHTKYTLAALLYNQASENLDQAKTLEGKAQRQAIKEVIAQFQHIINTYPKTPDVSSNYAQAANLAYAQIGRAYLILGAQDNRYYRNALDAFGTFQSKYPEEPPPPKGRKAFRMVYTAFKYAQTQVKWIQSHIN